MPKSTAKKEPSFEEQLARLEELVTRMETGELPIEALMAAYQDGMAIAKELGARLEQAQGQLTEIGKPAKARRAEAEQTSLLEE